MGMGFGFNDFGFSGFSTGFNIMGVFVTLIFVVVIGMFIVIAVKGISQWNKNNHSPRLTVPATIVAKRTNVSSHHHHNHGGTGMHHTTHSTTYYVTFQVESGDRMDLHVPAKLPLNVYNIFKLYEKEAKFNGKRSSGALQN